MSLTRKIVACVAVVVAVQGPAQAETIEIDFCQAFHDLIDTPVVRTLPEEFSGLVLLLTPPQADVNGNSNVDLGANPVVIDVRGNGMTDCDAELGLLAAVLADQGLDLSNRGGISHLVLYNAWEANRATLQQCFGVYWDLFPALLPGLQEILIGYVTIGDGSLSIPDEDRLVVSGSGGFVAALLEILDRMGGLEDPSLKGLENYARLPHYLAPDGDADADGYVNQEEYLLCPFSPEQYVASALDPDSPGPVQADFQAEPTHGLPPLTVQFYNDSGGDVHSFEWEFGDGETCDDVWEPIHTYTSYGLYTVCLSVAGLDDLVDNDAMYRDDYIVVGDPPEITLQPASLTVTQGEPAAFAVGATGTPAPSYQWQKDDWQKDDVLIPGATETSYEIPSAQASDEGHYACVASNPLGAAESEPATLTVRQPPYFIVHPGPAALSVDPGTRVVYEATPLGTTPIQYQWQKDGADVPGATKYQFVIASAQETDEGAYRCVATNACGSVPSNAAVLSVNDPPAIVTQPASGTVAPGQAFTFIIGATGTSPLAYQWQEGSAPIIGATTEGFAIAAAHESDEGEYACLVSNPAGAVLSDAANLLVLDPPVITQQPVSQTVDPGDPVEFAVAATGDEPMTYQWLRDEGTVGVGPTFTIASAQETDEASYRCLVSNTAGEASSAPAALSVNDRPAIVAQPQSQVVQVFGGVNFTVEATGSEPLNYQWRKDGEDIPGATLPALSILAVQESDAGSYTALVGNSAGVAVSQTAVLAVTVPDAGCAAGRVSWPADGGGRGARPLADIGVACAMAAVLVFRGRRDRARHCSF